MKKIIFSTVALFTVLLGLSYAYADEFRFGFSEENLVNDWLVIEYKISNDGGYDVWISQNSVFHYDTIYDVPEQMHFQTYDTQAGIKETVTILVRNDVKQKFDPEPEPPTEEPKVTPGMKAIEEEEAKREQKYEEALRCRYGQEGNSMFQAELEQRIAKEKIAFKQLPIDAQDKKLILAREACDVFFEDATMISQDREMQDKFLAQQKAELEEKQRIAKLEPKTDYTDPLTQEDFDKTIETAENLEKPYIDPYQGCIPRDENDTRCENRGGFNLDEEGNVKGAECLTQLDRVMCPQQAKNLLLNKAVSEGANYDIVLDLVCDAYLENYSDIVSRIRNNDTTAELPNWLAHCKDKIQ